MTPDGDHISFAALTAIHYTHRLMAYAVFALLGLAGVAAAASCRAARAGALAAGLALRCSLATGLSNVVLDWPLVAAVLHTGGAAALVVVLTWALCASRTAADTVSPAASRMRIPAFRESSRHEPLNP
jgi:cytochrome c oxidase assembly protein subunit 15